MEAAGLIRLERIAGNLPAQDMEYGSAETKLGKVYIALGRGPGIEFPGIAWHGVYAFEYGDGHGTARTGECAGELTLKEARQQFVDDAAWFMSQFKSRDMLEDSFRFDNA